MLEIPLAITAPKLNSPQKIRNEEEAPWKKGSQTQKYKRPLNEKLPEKIQEKLPEKIQEKP